MVLLLIFIFAFPVSAACDPSGVQSCVAWAEQEIVKLGCHVDTQTFTTAIEDYYLNKGCRLEGTRWYDISSGAKVTGSVSNGVNTDDHGCIARYTPQSYLNQGGYFRTPKEALNGPLRNKELSGCSYDSDSGGKDASDLTSPIISAVQSCACATKSGAANPPSKPRSPPASSRSNPGASSSESPADTPQRQNSPKKPIDFSTIQKKCDDVKNLYPTLTQDEFLAYIQKVEQENSDMTKNQIIAKLHQKAYEIDVDSTYFGIRLFQHGQQTDGFGKVKLPCRNEPKFVVTPQGTKIDIGHAYAGLRSDLNRGFLSRWLMRRVNTHWGDTYQTLVHWDNRYAPPDQRTGNDAGIWLAKYYLNSDNENKKLSEGFDDYFKSIDTHDVVGDASSGGSPSSGNAQ